MCELSIKLNRTVSREFKESTRSRILMVKTLFWVLSLLVLFNSPLFALQETKPKRVLVLASYKATAPIAPLWNRGIQSILQSENSNRIDINIEYLDLNSFNDDHYIQLLHDQLKHKFLEFRPDLIIPVYNRALGFVLKYREDLFFEIPVVFAGVEQNYFKGWKTIPNITGLLNVNSYKETLDLALNLHPHTKHVAVVSGAGKIGRTWGTNALEAFRPFEDRVEIVDLTGLPMKNILEKVANLPAQSVVTYIALLEDGDGNRFTAPESVSKIVRASSVPVYSFWELVLGHGIVGGYLSSAEERGKNVAGIALRVLNQENEINSPPIRESNSKYMFDWRQLKRWSISEHRMPPGSIVKFKEITAWDRYKGRIIGAIALIVFQLLIISYLLHQRRKRRRAELEIEERWQFEELVSNISAKFVDLDPMNVESEIGASLKQISEFLGFDRSSIFEYSTDRKQMSAFSYHAKEGIQPPPVTLPMDQFPWVTAKTFKGEMILFTDLAALGDDAELESRYFEQEGIRGGIILPLSVSGSTLGLVAFMVFYNPEQWPQSIIQRLRLVTQIFTNAMMRKQDEEKLLDAERKYRTVADYTYDWEYWENSDGKFQYISPSCEHISDYTTQEFMDNPSLLRDIIVPEDRVTWDQHKDDLQDERKSEAVQFRIQRQDGEIRWIEHVCQPVTDDQGSSLGYRASNRDITERKNKEFEVQNRLEFERFIAGFSSEFINFPADKLDAEIIDALSRIGTFMSADRSFFFQFNWKKTKFRISHLWEADGIHKDQVVRGVNVQGHFPWLANNLLAGKDIVISDVKEMPPAEASREGEYCQQIGIQSFIILPIQVQDAPLCAIGLDSIRTRRQWSLEERSRLRLIGDIFANAIARKHSEQELRETYTEIKQLKEELEAESIYLQEEINLEHNFENIIGQSEELKYVLFQVEQVAATDSAVLILGETGTGKELVARAIHKLSPRRNRVLVKVNCAALPADLIESELFGREKGAFTGATTTQIGRFELAKTSTILLDEIGELPLTLQAKLLHVLESGEFERLGNPKTLHSDARIITSTNRILEDEVRQGRFREDLWYRLKVFTVTLPPLRQRKEDIPLLVKWFMGQFSRKMAKPAVEISKHTIQALQDYHWPGNVRELKNIIESGLITARGDKMNLEIPQPSDSAIHNFKPLQEMERDYILQVLKVKNWKVQGANSAASVLQMNPNTLRARIKKLGIKKPSE